MEIGKGVNEEEEKIWAGATGSRQNGVVSLVQNDIILLSENLASADADDRSSENLANYMSFLT